MLIRLKERRKPGTAQAMAQEIYLARIARRVDWRRLFFILLGITLFSIVYLSPAWPDAVDPKGKEFILTREGKAAIGLFLLAAVWWIFEVVPIGVTSIAIGVIQGLFLIRPAKEAFKDFMDPSVWFIFGSVVIGMAFIAGAGSIVTLLGSARAAVAVGFFRDMTGTEISFFQLSYYMFPLGWVMVILLCALLMVVFKPEHKTIPGLKERVQALNE
jgi:di/tricarboxylate transporter